MREDDGRNYVQPVTGALGAEIHGVDLAETFNNETFSEIYDAFLDLLYDHTENPDFSCRFRWRQFDRHVGQPPRPASGQRRLFQLRTGLSPRPQTPSHGNHDRGPAILIRGV